MVQDFTDWGGVKGPFRVAEDDGRAVIGYELKKTWDDSERRWKYSDEYDDTGGMRIDKSAIKASCDTAAEAVALMEVTEFAHKAMLEIRRQAKTRISALEGRELPRASDVRLLALDDWDEWINPDTGVTLLKTSVGGA